MTSHVLVGSRVVSWLDHPFVSTLYARLDGPRLHQLLLCRGETAFTSSGPVTATSTFASPAPIVSGARRRQSFEEPREKRLQAQTGAKRPIFQLSWFVWGGYTWSTRLPLVEAHVHITTPLQITIPPPLLSAPPSPPLPPPPSLGLLLAGNELGGGIR